MGIPRDELKQTREQIWVLRAQEGDEESFRMLVEAYDRRLLYFVRRFERDVEKALDVVQEVWMTAFRKIKKLNSPLAFRTWLFRIAHTKVVTLIRHESRESVAKIYHEEMDIGSQVQPSNENIVDNAELVHKALDRVSPKHREVLTLRFLENMQLNEISEVLNCSNGTVKSRMHYAKLDFRKVIEELDNV